MNKENKIYLDKNYSIEDRVKDLLSRMTIFEKLAQMNMKSIGDFQENKEFNFNCAENKIGNIGIGAIDSVGSIITLGLSCENITKIANGIQRYLIENTRLGIPAFIVGEGLHGFVTEGGTMYPQSIGIGCSFNRDIPNKMGKTIAKEAKSCGINQLFAPNLDIARELRWGRVEETYGEDPYLIGEMGLEYIKGIQGESELLGKENVIATLKHYVAHGDPQGGVNLSPVAGGERLLRELYLKPFKKVFENINVLSVMPAYSEYDGIPVSASAYLLKELLRDELGFKGYTISDYEAIKMLHSFHKTAEKPEFAGIQALIGGIDLEAPYVYGYNKEFVKIVENNEEYMKLIDYSVSNILRTKFLAGLFDNPYIDENTHKEIVNCAEHKQLAYDISCETVVLLKNNGILPLEKTKKKIAIIGPNAKRIQFGDYSALKPEAMSVFKGLQTVLGDTSEIELVYSEGCDIYSQNKSQIQASVDIANEADLVIAVVGESSMALCGVGWGVEDSNSKAMCGEGFDRTDINLPGIQGELVAALINTGKPLVTVLINGRPLSINNINKNADAIIEAWYPGEEGGRAIADIIFGNVNPSGKLCVSIPKDVGQLPLYYNHKPSARGYYNKPGSLENPGRDYVFMDTKPLYEFGFGLSYTTFEYSNLTLTKEEISKDESLEVSVVVKNTGSKKGKESVLLFINDMFSSVSTPVKSLCGFEKIELEPNEEKTIVFNINKEHLSLFDINMNEVVESGDFEIICGNEIKILTVR